MTVLALRLASFSNGVSQLHGSVTRTHVERDMERRSGIGGSHRARHQRRALPQLGFF